MALPYPGVMVLGSTTAKGELAAHAAFNISNPLTIEIQFRVRGSITNGGLLYKGTLLGSQGDWCIGPFTGSANQVGVRWNNAASGATFLNAVVGTLYEIRVEHDGARQYAYVNGTKVTDSADVRTINANLVKLVVGNYFDGSFVCNGYELYSIRLSNIVRSTGASYTTYASQGLKLPSDANTVLLLNFTEGSGLTVADSGPNLVGNMTFTNTCQWNTDGELILPNTAAALSAPTGMSATFVAPDHISITWNNPSGLLDTVLVYVASVNDTAFASEIGRGSGGAFNFIVTPGTYYFWTKARNTAGLLSAFSSGVSATMPAPAVLAAPSNVRVTSQSASQVVLAWGAGGGSTYTIHRAPISAASGFFGTFTEVATGIAIGTLTYTDTSVVANQHYCYVVRSVSDDGATGDGNPVFAQTYGVNHATAIYTAMLSRVASVLAADSANWAQVPYVISPEKNGGMTSDYKYGLLLMDAPGVPAVMGAHDHAQRFQLTLYRYVVRPDASDAPIQTAQHALTTLVDQVGVDLVKSKCGVPSMVVKVGPVERQPGLYLEDQHLVAVRGEIEVQYRVNY